MADTKKRSRQIDLIILGVIFVGIFLYYFWPSSPEGEIKKQLKGLADLCSMSNTPNVIQASLASDKLSHFFQGNATIQIQSPGPIRIGGIADIKSKYLMSRKFLKKLEIGFSDVQVKKIESKRAEVSSTATFSGATSSGENFHEFQEVEIHFQYSEDLWKITVLKQIKAIE